MRLLSVMIALVLAVGIGAAALEADVASADVATAQDLRLIQSSATAVDALEAVEVSLRLDVNGQSTTMEGVANGTSGRFDVSVPGLDDFTLLQIGATTYLPAFAQPGWSEFVGPPGMTPEATSAVSGQDPLVYFRSITSSEDIEIRGRDTVDGVEVTQYRVHVDLADALRAAQEQLGEDLGVSESELAAVTADASPMQIDIDIDDAGIPRRSRIEYEVQGIGFTMDMQIRPVDAVPAVSAPPASEIVSSHTATDLAQFQELIASHLVQYAQT